jgi:hypothetical protein
LGTKVVQGVLALASWTNLFVVTLPKEPRKLHVFSSVIGMFPNDNYATSANVNKPLTAGSSKVTNAVLTLAPWFLLTLL